MSDILKRFFFAIIYAVVINTIVIWFMFLCAVIQHLHWGLIKSKNQTIQRYSNYLYAFLIQSLDYVMMNEDALPYPFNPFPKDINDKFNRKVNQVTDVSVTDVSTQATVKPEYKVTVPVERNKDVEKPEPATKPAATKSLEPASAATKPAATKSSEPESVAIKSAATKSSKPESVATKPAESKSAKQKSTDKTTKSESTK